MGPKKKIFRPAKTPRFAFPTLPPGFLGFGRAYRLSAIALSNHFPNEDTSIVAPLVFLYRHALETYLKGILIEYGHDLGIIKGHVVGRGHGLVAHLPDLRNVAAEAGHNVSPELEVYIKGMHAFDSTSEESRYPELRGSQPTSGATAIFEVPEFVETSEAAFKELDEIVRLLSYRKWEQILIDEGINPYDDGDWIEDSISF